MQKLVNNKTFREILHNYFYQKNTSPWYKKRLERNINIKKLTRRKQLIEAQKHVLFI